MRALLTNGVITMRSLLKETRMRQGAERVMVFIGSEGRYHRSLVTAIIESDSIINFDPMSGFQLANGKVFYQQEAQETSAAIESHGQFMESQYDSLARMNTVEEKEIKTVAVNKKREAGRWSGVLIVAVLCVGLLIRLTVKYPVLRPIIGACKKRNL